MRLIDTHCHMNLSNYCDDVDAVIHRALEADVDMIIASTDYKTSKKALDIANRYERGVSVAVGIHPGSLEERIENIGGQDVTVPGEKFNAEMFQQLAKFPKVVAIGEIGLDYYRLEGEQALKDQIKKRQKLVLWAQMELAVMLNLPVIIHCRQAHDDLLNLIYDFRKEFRPFLSETKPWGVIHCFSGDENLAWRYFNLGFAISFTGLITFSGQWDSLIRKMPSDRLLLETDAPFLTPEPYRGKRNEPILVKYVADRIAELRAQSVERIAAITTENAKRLFNL